MKNKLYVIGMILVCVIVIGMIVVTGINNSDAEIYKEKGNIIIHYERVEDTQYKPYVDEEWLNADTELDINKPVRVNINDNQNLLSAKDFLPTKAHFIKGEAIGLFLHEYGYISDEVTVVNDSLEKNKNSSSFCVEILGHPEIQLKVTYHIITEEFLFEIIPIAENIE